MQATLRCWEKSMKLKWDRFKTTPPISVRRSLPSYIWYPTTQRNFVIIPPLFYLPLSLNTPSQVRWYLPFPTTLQFFSKFLIRTYFSQKCIETMFIKPPNIQFSLSFRIWNRQSFTISFTPGIEKVDIFRAFSSDSHLGKIDSKRIGDQVIITVARSSGAPCGPAYVLRCTSSLRCAVVQTIITNAPTMEFLSYETFEAILVWHWDSGSNSTDAACKTEPEIYRYSFVCFHAVSLVSSTTSGIFSGFLIRWLDRVFHHLPIWSLRYLFIIRK